MIKEFIPYEQALELKELGFDEEVLEYYNTDTRELCDIMKEIKAPLYQQAFRWFREKCESTIHIYQYQDTKRWDFDIYDNIPEEIDFCNEPYDTYEEAELACIKKLIEIAKNNL